MCRSISKFSPKLAFVSYRRADSLAYAALIREKVANAFGREAVFRDASSIERGRDWQEAIHESLDHSSVALVIIGPHFVDSFRSTNPEQDWVLAEVKQVLEAKTKAVVPIYIAGTPAICRDELPPEIQNLATRQRFEIRDGELDQDIDALVQWLEEKGFVRQDRLTFGKLLLRALPGFLGLLMLSGLLVWIRFAIGLGQSWIVLIALGAVMFVIFQQVIPFGAANDDRPTLMARVTRWASVITFVSILAFILLGMTVRWPTDLIRELNPEIVKHYPFPRGPVRLDLVSDEEVFTKDDAESDSSMQVLNNALVRGLLGSGDEPSFFFELRAPEVARSDQSKYYDKSRNYEVFDCVLNFHPRPKAKLLSGIGILIQSVSPARWRQVQLDVPRSNWSSGATDPLANSIQDLRLEAGDRLVFALKFARLADIKQEEVGLDCMEVTLVSTPWKGAVTPPIAR